MKVTLTDLWSLEERLNSVTNAILSSARRRIISGDSNAVEPDAAAAVVLKALAILEEWATKEGVVGVVGLRQHNTR